MPTQLEHPYALQFSFYSRYIPVMKWLSHLFVKDRYMLAEQVQTKSLVVFWDYLMLMFHTAKKSGEDSQLFTYYFSLIKCQLY